MRNDNMVHVGRTRTMLLYLRRFQISEAEVAEEIGLKTLGLPAPHGPVVYIPAALAEKIAGAVASIRQSLEEEWCGDCGRRHDRAARLERLRTLLRRGPRDALELRLQMDCAYTDDDTGKRRGIPRPQLARRPLHAHEERQRHLGARRASGLEAQEGPIVPRGCSVTSASLGGDAFTLSIALGNEAMESVEDVAQALLDLGRKLAREQEAGTCAQGGAVLDRNGNTVGHWTFCRR